MDAPPGEHPIGTYHFAILGRLHHGRAAQGRASTMQCWMNSLTGGGMKQGDADTLLEGRGDRYLQVKKDGSLVKSNAQASFWKGYVMALLLSMTTMIYGMNVARSIIQEKTSRIFEVMLAIAKPSDMLAGKLIGVGAVGLTQIAIWLAAGAAIFVSPLAAAAHVR